MSGVLSSWDTLATKSRRIDSSRREFGEIVQHQHGPTRWQRARVHQQGAVFHLDFAVLHQLPLVSPGRRPLARPSPETVRGSRASNHRTSMPRIRRAVELAVRMRPRTSAAMTPSTIELTGRRFRLLPAQVREAIGQLAVHLPEHLHQATMSGMPEWGKRGGAPSAIARAADPISTRGRAIERPAASASTLPIQQRQQGGAGHGLFSAVHDFVHLIQPRGHPDHPGRPGIATYISSRPTLALRRLAAPASSTQCGLNLGTVTVVFQRGQLAGGKVAIRADPAAAVDQGNAMSGLRSETTYGGLPCCGIGGEGLADQARFALQRAHNVGFQIPAEGALGQSGEDPHRQHQDQNGSQDPPPIKAHLLRVPRSPPRRRYPNPRTVSIIAGGPELGAEALHVHVHCAGLDVGRRLPDDLQQLRPGLHPPRRSAKSGGACIRSG